MVMENPSPQCVGREFVRQYYTLLHEAPQFLHRFYSNQSSFIHGGVEKTGEEQLPITGQADIHKKIMSLNFRDCHAKIRQVDSQATVGNAVVVQVTGELSNNGAPMRRFMQTFVLNPQSPKKYYVHNDIFRYQDEVFSEGEEEMEVAQQIDQQQTDSEEEQQPLQHEVNDPNKEYYDSVDNEHQPYHSNGNEEQEEQYEEVVEDKVNEDEVVNGDEQVRAGPELSEEENFKTEPEPAVTDEARSKPFSWAELASKKGTAQSQQAPTVKQTTATKSEVKVDTASVTKPSVKPVAPAPTFPPRNAADTAPVDDRTRPRAILPYPDNQQVFVGNIPSHIDDVELRNFFEAYGKVVDMKITRKTGPHTLPSFGFVAFAEASTVQSILEQRPLYCHEHRLNVEEKKQRSELNQLPRPARGGMRGGRGGGGGPHFRRGGGPPTGAPRPASGNVRGGGFTNGSRR